MAHSPRISVVLRFCLLALLLVGSVACGVETGVAPEPLTPDAAAASTPVTLTIWHTVTPQQAETLQGLADEWAQAQNQPVTVELRGMAGAESLHQFLLAAIQTQHTPDLAFVRPSDLYMYAEADALRPLDSFWQQLAADEQADYFPTFLSQTQCHANNQATLLAIPMYRHQTALFVNRTLLDELKIANPPVTWDELISDCAMHREANRYACMSVMPTGDMATALFTSHGNPVVDAATRQTTLTEASAMRVLQHLVTLRDGGVLNIAFSADSNVLDFVQGRTLFAIERTDQMEAYADAIGESFGWEMAALPAEGTAAHTLATGGNLALFHSTPEREGLALALLHHLTTSEANARWADEMDAFPVRRSALATLANRTSDTHWRQGATLLTTSHAIPCLPNWQKVETHLVQVVADTLGAVSSPETLLAAAAQATNNLVR